MSPRPKKHRKLGTPPRLKGFKPIGVPMALSDNISVQYEEYEALRLADYENLSHVEAAKRMNVSRPTFTRMYEKIRRKLAEAFVEGKAIVIEGGDVDFDKQWYRCKDCHNIFHSKKETNPECTFCQSHNIEHINASIQNWRNRNRRGQNLTNQEEMKQEQCICPSCGYSTSHIPGIPCKEIQCPQCEVHLVRK